MTKLEHLIAIAEEECCELAQRCSKALRFGMTEIQPVSTGGDGQTDNRTRLREEYIDVVAMMEMLDILPPYTDEKTRKKEKVMKFLAYSSECGTVDDASPSDARFTPVEEGTAIGSATQTSSSSVTDTPDGSERPPAAASNPYNCQICRLQGAHGHWAWHNFCLSEINPIALIGFIDRNSQADAADKILRYVVAITGMDLKAVRAAMDEAEEEPASPVLSTPATTTHDCEDCSWEGGQLSLCQKHQPDPTKNALSRQLTPSPVRETRSPRSPQPDGSAHTKGPWYVRVGPSNGIAVHWSEDGQICPLRWTDGMRPEVEARVAADARLIAAAPELLEALKALADACFISDSLGELPPEIDGLLLDAALRAISKAVDEQPLSTPARFTPVEEGTAIGSATTDLSSSSSSPLRVPSEPSRWRDAVTGATCPSEHCPMCSGEACERHGHDPCDCDVIDRHTVPVSGETITDETRTT